MNYKRSSGIILHPTSLPGPDGIGDLGPECFHWIDFLQEVGCGLWQILPLGPTGYGDSPYQCFSAFAGNPYLISPVLLQKDGLLTRSDFSDRPAFPIDKVDFGPVIQWKINLLDKAFARYKALNPNPFLSELEIFKADNKYWLDDFALFMAIKESEGGVAWSDWSKPLRNHDQAALMEFRAEHQDDIERHIFRQFFFYRQWMNVKNYAAQNNILIIGDIPIFVSYDSADAWSHRDLFYMDKDGIPSVVAGVPPDYFSPTGQLWGNPLYRWKNHKETGYSWWVERLRSVLKLVDIIRLDHFRGFAGYWEVPFGNPTAEIGRWVTGPGADFFVSLDRQLGKLPIIAEDLGEITPDVIELRDQFQLPGMKILQFSFSTDSYDPFLPHNYPVNCVAYTGTHDNDTAVGWYETAPGKERDFCRRYLARSGEDIAWDLIRAVWSSVARFTLAPLQDFLSLGTDARMNFPGQPSGNWTWRMTPAALNPDLIKRITEMNVLFSRSIHGEDTGQRHP